jgi:hypothetical protein
MNDLDTRIRDTLHHVAATTAAPSRLDTLTSRRRRVALPAVAALALAVGALGMTSILLTGGESPRAPTGEGPSEPSLPGGVDPSWLIVEPEDIAAIVAATPDEGPNGTAVPGTRPSLRTESIWCVSGSPTTRITMMVSAGRALGALPLDVPVTEEALVEACLATASSDEWGDQGPDWGAGQSTEYTVCRGRQDRGAVWNDPRAYPADLGIVAGNAAAPGPGFPVVFDRAVDCATSVLGTAPPVILDDAPTLDALNRARDLEIAALGASLRTCLTVEQATDLAAAVHAELGSGWLLVEVPWIVSTMENRFGGAFGSDIARADCHGPLFDVGFGFVAGPSPTPWAPSMPPTSITTLAPDQVDG